MPPKGRKQNRAALAAAGGGASGVQSEAPSAPQTPTLAETLSYLNEPRPFKNRAYTKNANRRTKNLKTVLTQERERERVERERRRAEREEETEAGDGEEKMDVDGDAPTPPPTLKKRSPSSEEEEEMPTYSSIEAPPSILPQKHFCDITGLEAPYTEPATGLRYHDKSIYELIKGLSTSMVKEYLAARGVNPIVK
ncbi:hypothetical protein SCHPADRAFT_855736 [Schizopora paradoxa]|uniref:Vps72/YL1 C-terminal domain-containing protein n=1 Tax=Schizopora paradoxa TaxID=27342 RepID=A0A0H2RHV2_9AGAM|nr:hypothetical protein SCHPADRAFT_855736 [Schizopora paradoxa]